MQAFRNLVHAAVLVMWAVVGGLFTLRCLGALPLVPAMFQALGWWLWFGALVAITTLVVRKLQTAWAALAVHGAVFLLLAALPRVFPFQLARLGLDLLPRV